MLLSTLAMHTLRPTRLWRSSGPLWSRSRHSSWLLLDSRVVDLSMASNPTFVFLCSLEPLFFNGPENALRFSDNTGA
jgi:hypothetical protein